MPKQDTNIGELIRQQLKQVGMSKSEFARRIGTSPQNVYGIFRRKSCDTELLQTISEVLNYDFFQHYSTQCSKIAYVLEERLKEVVAELNIVKRENSLLKEIVELRKQKGAKK